MIITMLEDASLAIRKLQPEDADLLVKWLSDQEVLRYYEGRDRPHDAELVQRHFYENRDEVHACIIQYEGLDIGYIQYYVVESEEIEEYGLTGLVGEHIYGMDQFIGEVSYWNRGIGTKLMKLMTRYLTRECGAARIVMDPQAWNTRAIHVYERCGFQKIKLLPNHEWHEGAYRDCWLMEYADKSE
ncbi:GNAT family N-acetyltransferase [Paenibacillus sp. Marseille-Q4541]|uniref:GNAT family N-acetyltransferase n=1 Tax=Paenibacillus sp. Marseille-Q4541 TaxID=2831522 RepID=UPI00201864B7|nr:GNAT family N-acetyltransferase [Paenibacillus sp. Marseille-Q4541]